jgi:hypothetical protein
VSRVSHTPTYDQLRGERINVDVPASQAGVPASPADPEPLTRPGKHHLRDDAPTAVAAFGPSPRSGAGLAEDWPGSRTGDSDPRGKHAVPDDPPGATEVSGPSREPGADLAASWSWFGTGMCRFRRGLPPGCRVVGLCQIDGMPHESQRAKSSVILPSR